MKSVLISIRPKWCELIASGNKTIEVRKNRPRLETPFKCYIYCTKPKMVTKYVFKPEDYPEYMRPEKTVFCKDIDDSSPFCRTENGNGKVIGEFVCRYIEPLVPEFDNYGVYDIDDDFSSRMRLTNKDLWKYGNGKTLYGWLISDLKIYDKPKGLGEFYKCGAEMLENMEDELCEYCKETGQGTAKSYTCSQGFFACEGRWCEESYQRYLDENFSIARPPESWCYVEELS